MPGTFTLRPIQATLTHDTDWLGKMDPYCSYRVGPDRVKGPVCRNGGKFPKWEDATVSIPAMNEPSLLVDLLDKDKLWADGNIGSFVIDLQEIQSRGQLSKWYPVYYHKKPAGEILLEAAFQPEIIQQQPVVQPEPVIIKETIVEEPIIVKEVIQEEVIIPTETVTTQQDFHSGPIIIGTSSIHHGGQGYGLVPNHGPVLQQGSTIQQSTFTQGSNIPQGTFSQGSNIPQGTFSQGSTIQHGTIIPGQGTILSQGLSGNQGSLNQGPILNQGTNLNQGSNLNQGL